MAQIITKITDDYSSPEIHDAMLKLRDFEAEYPSDFARIFYDGICEKTYPSSMYWVDANRRKVSHYFYKIWLLLDIELLSEKYVVKVLRRTQADFYKDIIKPLDEARAKAMGEEYDSRCFDTILRLYDTLK